jgi:hypothetical protein
MCPFCLATIGSVVAGALSTAGFVAFAVKVFRKKPTGRVPPNAEERKNQNVDQDE